MKNITEKIFSDIRRQGEARKILVTEHELAKRASDLYESSRNELKNKLLKTIFSNLKSTNKKVDFSLLEGIDVFFCNSKTENWLPGLD